MKIVIDEPQRFYCQSDEAHFFEWLNGIESVQDVEGCSAGLIVEIDPAIDRSDFYDLVGLLNRYGLDCAPLKPICLDHSDDWFRDVNNYWYKSVFE